MYTPDTAPVWRRSRRCDNGDCVELAQLGNGVALRDSTRPQEILRVPSNDWAVFVKTLQTRDLRSF